MSIVINAPTVISSFWTSFKTSVTNKSLLMQYEDDGNVYTIFAFDSSAIAYVTTIWKGTVPDNVINSGYAQATNDSDKSDFETNYAPTANKTIGLQAVVSGAAITSRPLLIAGSDGTNARFLSTDTSGHPVIVGAAADGAAIAGNPVLIAGQDGVNAQSIATDGYGRVKTLVTDGTNTIGVLTKTLYSDPNGDRRTIHNSATITSSGSTVLTWVGHSEWYLIINLKNAPTGGSPTIQFTIEELDPIDQVTIINTEYNFQSVVFTAAGVGIVEVPEILSDTLKISWTVTGSSPSWTGVNVTFCGHGGGNAIEGQAEDGELLHDGPVPVAGVDASNLVHTLKVDDEGRLIVTTPSEAASTAGFANGRVVLATTTVSPIRETTYTEQAANAQRSLVSASASDTSAGTGARTVKITYYTVTMTGPFTETVTMNGTSAVNTVATDICFIEKMEVLTVGSTGSNVGIISLKAAAAGGGATVWTIAATSNLTFGAHHYTPTGKTTYITGFLGGIKGADTTGIFIKSVNPLTANAAENQISDSMRVPSSGQSTRTFGTALQVVGPARTTMYAAGDSSSSRTYYGSFDFFDR